MTYPESWVHQVKKADFLDQVIKLGQVEFGHRYRFSIYFILFSNKKHFSLSKVNYPELLPEGNSINRFKKVRLLLPQLKKFICKKTADSSFADLIWINVHLFHKNN